MTKAMYADNLEANLSNLVERLHRMAYIPQPVRRKYIPKPGSTKQRPLGLTHYCGTRKDGKGFRMKRVTARKKFVAKLKIFKQWLMMARTMKTREIWETAKAKLRGHYNYYGVTDNLRGIARFGKQVEKLLFKWLNRRGKKNSLNWAQFDLMLKRFPCLLNIKI